MSTNLQPQIPNCFYRVGVKALIFDKNKRFLMTKDERLPGGKWGLPGGGVDFGESVQECLRREVFEETGFEVLSVAEQPSYFLTYQNEKNIHMVHVVFETSLKEGNFSPSTEATEYRFFDINEAKTVDLFDSTVTFLELLEKNR